MSEKNKSFEEALAELEEIVAKLEQGDVPLEEAIDYYKDGMNLSKVCHDKLKNIEKKMSMILGEDGQVRPFSVGGEE
ncbi:exodeoxyribonuclease VII small subunit [Priestia taiwanensis]|uniref:Exodeoxyribonuclease 7 small subunit n=1 Tax=Priestia taiwanensis TaxID=1347902 RepID=A0A917EJM1_9BACI|nr:exodeoxyribonuclease VII small subunit [Priestia taiwanensis]MBM7361403.1 exodeoxyribonuclease VII small subunit [Priestia taiwanensis]GGE53874.1 exodeoxyribonuclease 7 small subunit [Priestia taiwanensis]